MDFSRSADEESLRRQVRSIADRFDLEYWRVHDESGEYPHEFFDAFSKEGWLGVAIPGEYGGKGLGISEACILMHEICASGAGTSGASPIHFSIFPSIPILRHAAESQKRAWLPRIARGEAKLAFSVTEPGAGTDTTRISTFASRDTDGYLINGRKRWSSNAANADRSLMLVRTTPREQAEKPTLGMSLFLVDLSSAGIRRERIETLGRRAVDSNRLQFDNVRVPAGDLIGREGQGFYHLLDALNAERLLVAAEAIGMGRAALRLAVEYANKRVVFGRPIGANQGLQFPLAEAYSKLEVADLMVRKGAWLCDQRLPCGAEANIAKLRAAEAGFEACDTALQVFGGMGYAKETHIERLWREVRLYRIAPVSQEMVLNFLGEHVLGLPKAY